MPCRLDPWGAAAELLNHRNKTWWIWVYARPPSCSTAAGAGHTIIATTPHPVPQQPARRQPGAHTNRLAYNQRNHQACRQRGSTPLNTPTDHMCVAHIIRGETLNCESGTRSHPGSQPSHDLDLWTCVHMHRRPTTQTHTWGHKPQQRKDSAKAITPSLRPKPLIHSLPQRRSLLLPRLADSARAWAPPALVWLYPLVSRQ